MSKNKMIYFIIANTKSQQVIGEFINNLGQKDKISESRDFSKQIIETYTSLNKGDLYSTTTDDCSRYYQVNKSQNLYLAILQGTPNGSDFETVKELIKDLEYQSITKFVDSKGKLTNVGKQNLNYLIEKYFNQESSRRYFIEESNNDKVIEINTEVSAVKDNMKDNMKRLVSNIESSKELENKSNRISETSFMFRKDAQTLFRQARCRNLKITLTILVLGTIVLSLLIYLIFN